MDLHSWGWSAEWEALNSVSSTQLIARVIEEQKGRYHAQSLHGELNLYLSGKFLYLKDSGGERPAVGDWCRIGEIFLDETNQPAAVIQEVLPRKSSLTRVHAGRTSEEQVLAANVDFALISVSGHLEINLRSLERYVFLAKAGGVTPVLVVTKKDLLVEPAQTFSQLRVHFPEVDVLATSSLRGEGLDELRRLLKPHWTAVLIGPSGSGKSSLVNSLLQKDFQRVAQTRVHDGKGRHTTTGRQMRLIPTGGMIIDTPGLRELQLFGKEDALQSQFSKVQNRLYQCRFTDCRHETEPGCAVRSALQSGELSNEEWESFCKLQRELEYSNRKMDMRKAAVQKKKWKKITMDMRSRRRKGFK